jgi:NhaP-type Na+/H+ or K+/H+ antiporter
MEAWSNIPPNVVQGIFLPILLFDSAFSVDFHIFRRSMGQILLLAGPGVALSTFLFALVAIWWWPTWEWPTALMFGAIMSATDPVAVVALMREVGASKRLSTLIEGESLINDGTAMLCFSIFKGMAFDGDVFDVGSTLTTFLKLAVGGPVLGLVAGKLLEFLLSYIYNDEVSETMLTLLFAYFVFFFAEYGLPRLIEHTHVSGALAVVVLGLYMSYKGKLYISAQSEHSLHAFWTFMEYVADTVIFCVTGVIISKVFFDKRGSAESVIERSDWGYLALLYLVMHVVRLICLGACWPLVNKISSGKFRHDSREFAVLWASGLRGAVGLSLALEVDLYDDTEPLPGLERHGRQRKQILFFVCGATALTLLVNASLIKPLIQAVLPTIPRKEARAHYTSTVEKVKEVGHKKTSELAYDSHGWFSHADWWEVRRITFFHSTKHWNAVVAHLHDGNAEDTKSSKFCLGCVSGSEDPVAPPIVPTRSPAKYTLTSTPAKPSAAKNNWGALKKNVMSNRYHAEPLFRVIKDVMKAEKHVFEQERAKTAALDAKIQMQGQSCCINRRTSSGAKASELASTNSAVSVVERQKKEDMQLEARLRFFRAVKVKYTHMNESGFLGVAPTRLLMEAVDETIDNALHAYGGKNSAQKFEHWLDDKKDWLSWDYLDHAIHIPKVYQMIMDRRRKNCFGKLLYSMFSSWVFHHITFSYEVAQAYYNAQFQVEHEDLVPTAANHYTGLINGPDAKILAEDIRVHSADCIEFAKARLRMIEKEFPEVVAAIHSRQVASITLQSQQSYIDGLRKHGMLTEEESNTLMEKVNRAMARMLKYDHHDPKIYTTQQLLQQQPFYDHLFGEEPPPGSEKIFEASTVEQSSVIFEWNVPEDADTTDMLSSTSRDRLVSLRGSDSEISGSDRTMRTRSTRHLGQTAYIIVRGQARLSIFHDGEHVKDRMLDTGATLGLAEMLHIVESDMNGDWGWRITAETNVTTWQISQSEVLALMKSAPLKDSLVWRLAGVFIVFAGVGHAYTTSADSSAVARQFSNKRWGYLSERFLDYTETKHERYDSLDAIVENEENVTDDDDDTERDSRSSSPVEPEPASEADPSFVSLELMDEEDIGSLVEGIVAGKRNNEGEREGDDEPVRAEGIWIKYGHGHRQDQWREVFPFLISVYDGVPYFRALETEEFENEKFGHRVTRYNVKDVTEFSREPKDIEQRAAGDYREIDLRSSDMTALVLAGHAVCTDHLQADVGSFVAPHASDTVRLSKKCQLLLISPGSMGNMKIEQEGSFERIHQRLTGNDHIAIVYSDRISEQAVVAPSSSRSPSGLSPRLGGQQFVNRRSRSRFLSTDVETTDSSTGAAGLGGVASVPASISPMGLVRGDQPSDRPPSYFCAQWY